MIGALIHKELREHRVYLILLWLLGGLVFVVKLGADSAAGTAGSSFASLRGFLNSVQVILTFFLCERLVHREYRAKTQLFLEALPLRRIDMLGVKFSLALLQVFLMVSLSLLVCAALAWHREGMSWGFLGLLSLRALAAAFFWFSFIFMMSLLGKFRLGLYLIISIVTFTVHLNTAFDWGSFGPMELLSPRFAFERDLIPWGALAWSLGLSFFFCALGFGLALVREGSVATLLAEKMNHREKIFVSIAIISTLMVVVFVSEDEMKEPYSFQDYARSEGDGFVVDFAVLPGISRTEAGNWAFLHRRVMDLLKQDLGLPFLPNTFVMSRQDFDADKFERSDLQELEGLILRANFESSDFNLAEYAPWLTREILLAASRGRVGLEPRRWVLDGYALLGPVDSLVVDSDRERINWMRAAYGVPEHIASEDLEQWLTFRARVGDKVAMAVAWSGLKTLAGLTDEASLNGFFRAVLAKPVPDDFRALLYERKHSVMKDLVTLTGVEPETLLAAWNRNLEQARGEYQSELARVPRLSGGLKIDSLAGHNRSLTYFPLVADSADGALAAATAMEIRFQVLPLLAGQVDPRRIQTLAWNGQAGSACALPGVFQAGQRIATTLAYHSPVLACEVLSGWIIQEVE